MKYHVTQFIHDIEQQLIPIYKDPVPAQQAAWWLLEKLTTRTQAALIAQGTLDISAGQQTMLAEWIVDHVKNHKPLQYIIGSVPFLDLDILVQPPLLIPRPETEEWTSWLIDKLVTLKNTNITILDLGTGSGCIALALAKALPNATIYAADISELALALTTKNMVHNNIAHVKLILSNVYEHIPKNCMFDLIVSNPPYIAPSEWQHLDTAVTQWEDKHALVAQNNGLAIIEQIIAGAQSHIQYNKEMKEKNIPQLVLEIGYQQAEAVTTIMEKANFHDIHVKKDLEGKDRVVSARIS